jgi:hypothetical protein
MAKNQLTAPHEPFWRLIHRLVFHYGPSDFEGMKAYKDENDAVLLLT